MLEFERRRGRRERARGRGELVSRERGAVLVAAVVLLALMV